MARPGGDIITLALGRLPSYVAAHFFNIQDETLGYLADEDLGAAAAEVLAGKVFTHTLQPHPRLVIVGEAGCCGGLRLTGAEQHAAPLWDGPVQTLQQERVPVSKYQQLLASEEPQRHDDATPTDAGRAASDRHQRARGGAQAGGEACRERDGPRAADEAQRRCDTGDSEEDPCEEAAVALDSGGGPAHFTDFCKAVLHPRSVVQVPVPAAAAGCGFGDLHASGAAAAEAEDETEERLRWFAEGCDRLEGFHALAHPCDRFTGLSAASLGALRDAYPKTPVLLFSLAHATVAGAEPQCGGGAEERGLTAALAAARWGPTCSLRVPLDVSASGARLRADPANLYHASALYGVAIDNCTLPYRLFPGPAPGAARAAPAPAGPPSQGACAMADLVSALAFPGANLAALSCTLPANSVPAVQSAEHDARLSARERRLRGRAATPPASGTAELVADGLQWLSSLPDPLAGLLAEDVTWRGGRMAGAQLPASAALQHLQGSLRAEGLRAVRRCCTVAMPLPVPLPFPHIFGPWLMDAGDVVAQDTQPGANGKQHATSSRVTTCPVLTRLAASRSFRPWLHGHAQSLHSATRSAVGTACLRRWGLAGEDVAELREQLLDDAGKYEDEDERACQSSDDDVGAAL